MSWHPRQLGRQAGRTFVVTGANSGIGFAVARELVARGAHVVLAVRDTAKGAKAAADLAGRGSTSVVELDLSDLDRVAGCATTLLDRREAITALICNAGVMGGPLALSPQGFERQMATNHLGHAALVAALWPLLHASVARVVVMSSTEARGGQLSPQTTGEQLLNPAPYDGRQVYRNTKQANLLFAQELHRRCAKAGSSVSAVAVHPGASATNLLAAQLEQSGRGRLAPVTKAVTGLLLQSAAAGAWSTLRALDPGTPSGAFMGPARFGQLRGGPQPLEVYASAKQPATAARLWQLPSRCSAGRWASDLSASDSRAAPLAPQSGERPRRVTRRRTVARRLRGGDVVLARQRGEMVTVAKRASARLTGTVRSCATSSAAERLLRHRGTEMSGTEGSLGSVVVGPPDPRPRETPAYL